MSKKILFIQDGSLSYVNQSVAQELSHHFPEYELVVYDISQQLKRNRWLLLINGLYFIREYLSDLLFGYKTVKELKSSFFVTTYFFEKVKSSVVKFASHDSYVFTIQTQSQFDSSLPSIPHFVYTDHTQRANFLYPDVDYRNYMKPNRYLLQLEKKVYEHATLIFTYSHNIAASLTQQYGTKPSKVKTIGVGCNVVRPDKVNTKKYESKNILFVGVEWERKGGDLLLSAFRQVLRQVPEAQLTIVGCQPQGIDCPNVNIVGRVPLADVPQYYQEAAVFCMPARREPFGLVYLEAMIYQLPVVALPIGALPELVTTGHNGYLVNSDPDALAEKLVQLITNPAQCAAMGQSGASMAERYNWSAVGREMKESIHAVIQEELTKTSSSLAASDTDARTHRSF